MKTKFIFSAFYLLFICNLLADVSSFATVPKMINYQGKLTDHQGASISDTLSIQFTIHDDSISGTVLWNETQSQVVIQNGVFSVLLGSVSPIPDSVFDGDIKYLGVKVGDDSEMKPRKAIVSVGYAYRAATVQSGGFNCSDCDDRFVNVQGPDSVVSSSDTALLVRISSGTGFNTYGILGKAENTSSGDAYGGFFETNSNGTGEHFAVRAEGYGASSATVCGIYGYAENTSSGNAHGGWFRTSSSGSGLHVGVLAEGYGSSSGDIYGTQAYASNSSSGATYGGHFAAFSHGTGTHYGIEARGYGSSASPAVGIRGWAENTSTGSAYGGIFIAASSGTGTKYGVYANIPTSEGYAGYFDGDVYIHDSLVVNGAKSAAVKVGNGEYRLLYSQESPEVWFEDFGEGQLINGRTHIELDPLFLKTVTINSQHSMKVFIQLTSGEPMTVVVNKGATGFNVLAEDVTSNATFDYRVVAKRKGFESIRLARMGGPTPEEVEAEQVKLRAEMEQEELERQRERERMETERAKMEEERITIREQLK